MRILLLMLLSQCKPWLPLLAAGPQPEDVNLHSDSVPTFVFGIDPPHVVHIPNENLMPLPPSYWQPITTSIQPCFNVVMPDPRVDSLKKVVDSMAGLQRAQLCADSVLQVQLKQQQQRFSSLQQAHADTLREKSWFRAASMVLGGIFLLGMIWVGWRYRGRAQP